MAKRTYGVPAEVRTALPCRDREDFLSAVRIASRADCLDRTATCNASTGNMIVFRANCRSKASREKFNIEVGYVVQFLQRRPK